MLAPVILECTRAMRADHDDLGVLLLKGLVVAAQLRQMPTAKRSKKAPAKDQHNVLLADVIGQPDCPAFEILQCEIFYSNFYGCIRHPALHLLDRGLSS